MNSITSCLKKQNKMNKLLLLLLLCSCGSDSQVRFVRSPSDSIYTLVPFDSLTIVSGATFSGGVFTITGTSNVASRIEYPRGVTPAYLNEKVIFTPVSTSSGRISFGIGSNDNNYGSVIIINDTGLVKVAKWSGDSTYSTPSFTFASGIDITDGLEYTMQINKRKGYIDFILTHNGQAYKNTFWSFYSTAGSFMGKPSVICEKGVVDVDDWSYNRPTTNPQFAIFGDSFIGDGDSLPYKKYVGLIEDSLGAKNLYISGHGGESTTGFISSRMNTELNWLQGVKTVLIALGTNDNNYATYVTNMNTIINAIKAHGCTPILVTITPRSDISNAAFIAQANPWVRASGYKYVDIYNAVTTDGVWKTGYQATDNVHPTDLGYAAMWEEIKKDIGTELKK